MDSEQKLLSPDFYVDLKRSEFHVPVELAKKNIKNLGKLVERHHRNIQSLLKQASKVEDKDELVKRMDRIIKVQETFNKKLQHRTRQHNEFMRRLVRRADRLKRLEQISESEEDTKVQGSSLIVPPNQQGSKLDAVREFYNEEINILVAEYLLRTTDDANPLKQMQQNVGYQFAQAEKIGDYIDSDVLLQGLSIYRQIVSSHNLTLLQDWCRENATALEDIDRHEARVASGQSVDNSCSLTFHAFKQSFIEKVEHSDFLQALYVAKERLIPEIIGTTVGLPHKVAENRMNELITHSALMWFDEKELQRNEPSKLDLDIEYYDDSTRVTHEANLNVRAILDLKGDASWMKLGSLFLHYFNIVYGIQQSIPLIKLLNIGGSVLKTRSCTMEHHTTSTGKANVMLSLPEERCPVCSSELSQLASKLPFSHQVSSNIYEDPVMLPNGNIYPSRKLLDVSIQKYSELAMLSKDSNNYVGDKRFMEIEKVYKGNHSWNTPDSLLPVFDPLTGEDFRVNQLRRVFPI